MKNASFGLWLAHCAELLLPILASCLPAKIGNVGMPGNILFLCHRRDVCRSGDTSRGSSHLSARTKHSAEKPSQDQYTQRSDKISACQFPEIIW